MIKTPVAVRVIAKGGKFLGDDIGGALVTIHHARTGELLASGRTRGGSGDLWAIMIQPRARTVPIPAAGASVFAAEIATKEAAPVPLLITARGPGAGLQSMGVVSATQWIVPGLREPGTRAPVTFTCLLELPGLIVQVMEPATHTNVTKLPQPVDFRVNVAMMCGCPIDDGTDTDGTHTFPNPWRVEDFVVGGTIRCAGQPDQRLALQFDPAKSPGRFAGRWVMKKKGFYECDISAYQRSTGNTGTATVSVFSV